ncbi:MAG: hypothetical protein SF053_19960 [Bacteroidia bacterium]|nr:hypothetical protein [Bacteroidia bacterium]
MATKISSSINFFYLRIIFLLITLSISCSSKLFADDVSFLPPMAWSAKTSILVGNSTRQITQKLNTASLIVIEWGDGSQQIFNAGVTSQNYTHTYNIIGTPEIKIYVCPDFVQEISINNQNITQVNVASLTNLEIFSAYTNKIQGLVDFSGSQYSLKSCKINSNNTAIGPATIDLGLAVNLEYLNIENSKFTGILDLGGASKLINLYANNNTFTSVVFPDQSIRPSHPLIDVYLQTNNISGVLDFSNFPNLKDVHIYFNQISGLLVSNLPVLQTLRAENNKIKGFVDLSGSQVSLKSCRINNNNTAIGSATIDLGLAVNLEYLNIQNSKFTGILDLGGASKLINLYANNNTFTSVVFPDQSIRPSHPLIDVWLQTNNISGVLDFSNFPNLKDIQIHSNQISGLLVSNLPVLQTLWAESNKIEGFVDLSGSQVSLKSCRINSNNTAIGSATIDLGSAVNLEYLNIQNSKFTGILDLGGASKLINLYANNNTFTSVVFPDQSIRPSHPLIDVWLFKNNISGTLDFSNFYNLKVIRIYTNQITGVNMTNLPLLEEFTAYSNKIEGVVDLTASQNTLKDCNISSNNAASANATIALGSASALLNIKLHNSKFEGVLDVSGANSLTSCEITNNLFTSFIPPASINTAVISSRNFLLAGNSFSSSAIDAISTNFLSLTNAPSGSTLVFTGYGSLISGSALTNFNLLAPNWVVTL